MTQRANFSTRVLTFEIDGRASDDAIPVVVSTDAPVEMPDGIEILDHSPAAIDLSRAPLPIIAGHRGGQINVGLVDGLQPQDGKLRGLARFGVRTEAAEYKADVLSGVIRSVSVGYKRIDGMVRRDGVLLTTRWQPHHVAMVAEPADRGAGFFREAVEEFNPKTEVLPPAAVAATTEGAKMAEQQTAAGETKTVPHVEVVEDFDAAKNAKARVETIRKLAASNDISDEPQIMHWIRSGKSWDGIADDIIKIKQENSKASPAVLGLTPAEKNRFNIMRAITAVADGNWAEAGFEAEVSRATAQRMGKQLGKHSFIMPTDILQRVMIVGTATQGGYLVGTDNQPASFIELLRNRSVAFRMGATTLPGLVGSVTIPTQAAAGAVAWLLENGTATANELTVGQKSLTMKTVGGYMELSRNLMMQSSPAAEGLVNSDLAALIALKLDAAVLAGTSTDSSVPLGIRYTSGLGTANPTSGTAVAYGDLIRFQSTVASSNAFFANFGYVMHPAIAALLMGKPRFTNSDTPIWQGGILDGQVVGQRAMSSLQITSGTMLGGDFSQVVVGEWGTVEIEANPYANFQAGIVGIRAFYSADVLVRYGAAFAIGTGVTG